MQFKLSPLSKTLVSILTTVTMMGCNDADSTVDSKDGYFDTTNPPNIIIKLPPTDGLTAKLSSAGEVSEPVQAKDGEAVVYYVTKPDQIRSNQFANYSLHIWNNDQCDRAADDMVNGAWDNTQNTPTGIDNLGPYWKINLKDGKSHCINFIVRDDKLSNVLGGDAQLDFNQISDLCNR